MHRRRPRITHPPRRPSPPAAAPAAGQQCREYQSTAVIDGQPQPTDGTACLQPDGTWRIVK
jgi:surface antigen